MAYEGTIDIGLDKDRWIGGYWTGLFLHVYKPVRFSVVLLFYTQVKSSSHSPTCTLHLPRFHCDPQNFHSNQTSATPAGHRAVELWKQAGRPAIEGAFHFADAPEQPARRIANNSKNPSDRATTCRHPRSCRRRQGPAADLGQDCRSGTNQS